MKIISGIIGAGPNRGWNLVRIAVAVVLLVAAGLKTHQLATEPTLDNSILESRWFLMAEVEGEILFGLWLLGGMLPKLTWMATIGCFGVFTCVSLYKALAGFETCGCFGSVKVNPWYTSGFDLAILASLLKWRPRQFPLPVCERGVGGESVSASFPRFAVIAVLWLTIGLPAGYAMDSYADTTLSDVGQVVGNGKIVVLEPEKWIGKRFPLLPFIEDYSEHLQSGERSLRERLVEGEWIVVLFHYDCQNCKEAIPRYEELARRLAAKSTAPQVALIEIPPYGNREALPVADDTQCILGRLSDEKEWFVKTPTEIEFSDLICLRSDRGD